MCIDYRKLNKVARKDHFPLPFIDEMLERLAKHSNFCYLDGYSVHGTSFENCLANLEKVLKRCGEVDLVLNWEKCHFIAATRMSM